MALARLASAEKELARAIEGKIRSKTRDRAAERGASKPPMTPRRQVSETPSWLMDHDNDPTLAKELLRLERAGDGGRQEGRS